MEPMLAAERSAKRDVPEVDLYLIGQWENLNSNQRRDQIRAYCRTLGWDTFPTRGSFVNTFTHEPQSLNYSEPLDATAVPNHALKELRNTATSRTTVSFVVAIVDYGPPEIKRA